MTAAVTTDQLTKRYGDVLAVDTVHLRVEPGQIYALLGLNGAGKTTIIRMLLGMVRPSSGPATLLGRTVQPGTRGPWERVGYLVESPTAYPDLTVRENLRLAMRLRKITDPRAVDDAMSLLTLTPYAERRAGTLSLGNAQRLGLAKAVIHHPDLLILDEPTNGLDPAGVVEIRQLLRRLALQEGVTILLSSHLLAEVARTAGRIGILHQGHLIGERDADVLEKQLRRQLQVSARDLDAAARVLLAAGYPCEPTGTRDLSLTDARAIDHPEEIATLLVEAGCPPTRLLVVHDDLETYFLRLVGNDRATS